MIKEQLIPRITEKHAHLGVVGLGYVGLPLLVEFARSGFLASPLIRNAEQFAEWVNGKPLSDSRISEVRLTDSDGVPVEANVTVSSTPFDPF